MADHARDAIHGEPTAVVDVDAALRREMRKAWRYFGARGRHPQGVVDAVLGIGDYWKRKDDWLSDIGEYRRTHPQFTRMWYVLRLCCEDENCEGHMVVRSRNDRKFKIAGCSEYRRTGCHFVLGSREYARRKGEVIIALLHGVAPERAYFIREREASQWTA